MYISIVYLPLDLSIYLSLYISHPSKHSAIYLTTGLSYFEVGGVGSALEATLELENHSRIDFDGDNSFRRIKQLFREISCSGSDLEDDVRGFYARLLHDGVDQHGVLQNVLTLRFLERNSSLVMLVASSMRLPNLPPCH